jgi:hypothetical protein
MAQVRLRKVVPVAGAALLAGVLIAAVVVSQRGPAPSGGTRPEQFLLGPGCPTAGGEVLPGEARPGDGWTPDTGGWTGNGCSGATRYTALANAPAGSWQDGFEWAFRPGVHGPASCTVAVHIPASPRAGGPAAYRLYGSGEDDLAGATIDQAKHRGEWVGAFRTAVPDGTALRLRLTDAGRGRYTVAADAVIALCSAKS